MNKDKKDGIAFTVIGIALILFSVWIVKQDCETINLKKQIERTWKVIEEYQVSIERYNRLIQINDEKIVEYKKIVEAYENILNQVGTIVDPCMIDVNEGWQFYHSRCISDPVILEDKVDEETRNTE